VPLARTDVDRDTKVDQILSAAERRLLAGGYDAMSIAAVARELGIAQNSIYWYFPSKDELFVAVLQRLLARLASKKPPKRQGLESQVLWAADQMHDLAPLRAELHHRAARSPKVAQFEADLDATVRRLLIHGIEPYMDHAELDLAADTCLATVEGTLRMNLSRSQRHRLIRFALDRIIDPNSRGA
jgi:AcrR family transcriptional regulator